MNILKKIKTIEEFTSFKNELTAFLLDLSGTIEVQIEDLLKKYSRTFAELITQELAQQGKFDTKSVHSYLLELNEALDKVQILELSVAITPTEEIINSTYEWVLNNIDTPIVLKFIKNPLLIGGAILSYKGNYLDFSIGRKLKSVLPEYNPAKI